VRRDLVLPLIVFFLSGFAALVYQVIWQRLLVFFSGADVFSVTVIVAAFMAGLGAGSLAGGHVADRLGARASLTAFAIAELVVGLFGIASKPLYYDTLYVGYADLAPSAAVTALVLFLTLLVPTFVMGLSFPLLARAVAVDLSGTPRVVGRLYAWNTLGAAAGALTAPWVLIPRFGLEQSLWIAAAGNGICAAAVIVLAMTRATPVVEPSVESAPPPAGTVQPLSFRTWVAVYALTGFVALGLEIAWFRLLGVLLKSTAFTFGTLLAIYLSGLGAGAAAGARRAARSLRPGATFLSLQYAVTLYAAVSTIVLVASIGAGHPIKLVRFLGSYDPVDIYGTLERVFVPSAAAENSVTLFSDFVVLYFVVPAVLIGPPTFLLGMSFPYLQKATQIHFPSVGRRLGALLAANIAGGVCGATVVGWLLLPLVGTAGTLKLLVATGAIVAVPWAALRWPAGSPARRWAPAAAAAASLVAIVMMPGAGALWSRLHATTERRVFFDEDGAGLSLVKADPANSTGLTEVYVNGLGQSWIPYGNIHTVLGALPVFMHPAPAAVAMIGLGSGDTAFAAAGRADLRRLVLIEILGAQRRTLERLGAAGRYPGLLALLSDPRIEHRVGDGRAYLLRSDARFDIIEADALRPTSAYAGNLYSREYFALVASRLQPHGLAVTWAPTARVRATFHDVFPHVAAFKDGVYVGSNTPLAVDAGAILTRAAAASEYYFAAGIDIVALLRPYVDSLRHITASDGRGEPGELNTDMFPRDEFALPF
jgi:predicted membrane-bound spermidine synthase